MPESLKTSTIFVTVGRHTHVYRNPSDMPESVRKKVDRVTSSANSYTITIADRKSKQEIVEARTASEEASKPVAGPARTGQDFASRLSEFRERRRWMEIFLLAALFALLWAIALSR